MLADMKAPVCALSWHPTRRQLLSACEDATLRVWEICGEGRAVVAACVTATAAGGSAEGGEGLTEALPSYALALSPAPSGLQFCCGLEDGSLAVLL